MFIDLHTHTTCSDGTLTPEALVHYARRKQLQAVAITDHDTVSGNEKAMKVGKLIQMEVVPGVELSAESDNGSLHILGLFVDSSNTVLQEATAWLQKKRRERNLKILQELQKERITLQKDEFLKNAYLGRPHIAENLMQLGYVESIEEAFQEFLGKGASAYVKREKLSEEETLKSIIKAGGVPFLAHPKTAGHIIHTVERLIPLGLKGIEVYYPTHSEKDVHHFEEVASKYDLLMTGGSDFHGLLKPGIDLGCMHVPAHLLDAIKETM